jgi:hypothetical protein
MHCLQSSRKRDSRIAIMPPVDVPPILVNVGNVCLFLLHFITYRSK